jgi:hypothetical protein
VPRVILDAPWPVDTFSLGVLDQGSDYAFDAELRDAAGELVLRGRTPSVRALELSGATLPLLCIAPGAFARAVTGIRGEWPSPLGTLVGGRYALLAGGAGSGQAGGSSLYDVAFFDSLTTSRSLTRTPRALAAGAGQQALIIDASGATEVDFAAGSSTDVELPPSTAEELVDGTTITADDGAAYVVGATRVAPPTQSILRYAAGVAEVLSLRASRAGAAASWMSGRGLVVVGGNESGDVEVLAPGASVTTSYALRVPYVRGAAVVAGASGALLVLGGVDATGAPSPILHASLDCGSSCTTIDSSGSVDLRHAATFVTAVGTALVFGTSSAGDNAAYRVDMTADPAVVTAVPLRSQRRGAASIGLGNGYVAIVGGTDAAGHLVPDVEVFTPR